MVFYVIDKYLLGLSRTWKLGIKSKNMQTSVKGAS